MVLHKPKGTTQRGLFFGGAGLQAYVPGQNCNWKILVPGVKFLILTFEKVALGYDDLDYVTVAHDHVVKKKVSVFGRNVKVKVSGNEANALQHIWGQKPLPGFNKIHRALPSM